MKYFVLPLVLALSACVNAAAMKPEPPVVVKPISYNVSAPAGGKITVAVYGYNDLTGQRAGSTLSAAVTQGAENYLIDSLKTFSNGKWFRVVERKGIDNVVRERQIAKSARDTLNNKDELPPLQYAGIIIEGGIIGYDSNVSSGGDGARILGVGTSTKYTTHVVTVSLRTVSVASSEVLNTIIIEKQILSYSENTTVTKFFDMDTKTLELETGTNTNEAPSYAVQKAIAKGVYELVIDGKKKGLW